MENLGLIVFYSIFGFFALIMIIVISILFILWRRRKYIFTNFLNDSGQWERKAWKPDKIKDNFVYNDEIYKFDIKKCTRDAHNRPIAHYFLGNPEQMILKFADTKPEIKIGTNGINTKDFRVLMLSKVLRDIFSDEDVMNLLIACLICICLFGIATVLILLIKTPVCDLHNTNETINIIAEGVKVGIKNIN